MTENLVVIPYLASQAQGDELALALAGWRQHFMEPHRLVVVGDEPKGMALPEGVYFLDCPRVNKIEGQYTPHIDMVHKFRLVRECFPMSKGFIYSCDDMYAVKDFSLKEVQTLKLPVTKTVPPMDWRKEKNWWRDLGKTWELNYKSHAPVNWNWVCHLPIYYDWDRLLDIYDRYDCYNNSYIVENIYFNQRMPKREEIELKGKYGHEVLTSMPDFMTAEQVKQIWITNANSGWSRTLEQILKRHYGII